ncbi:PREDICTED: DNA-directed RNA polymerase II subunit RPB1-like isoform X2 [Polistes dominula]|uniref:DNA-directed RNA polymerase II subunit RPB1-like isoform X2 n=1 Tax=Polistes dominula TaxID=743375 RepID=A0ABM1I1Y6_POLDO|nr:PREDICTED: DNA-directed RNA polymerase II subunit RPB1-like isoform X2 [Polistes dominula]
MKRSIGEENGDSKRFVKQEPVAIKYEGTTYTNYSSSTTSPSTSIPQPLPGQPPLPPMPPPPSGIPPPPHVFGPVPSQVTPIQTWTQAPTHWSWITTPLPQREIQHVQREIVLRGNYMGRERYPHNRNNMYMQRNNFHRRNRRLSHFGQPQGQFDQASYLGSPLTGGLGLEWQRNNYNATPNDAIMNHMPVPLSNHPVTPITQGIVTAKHREEKGDQNVKIVVEEVVVKNNKQRKSMSLSYPSRPWNREDAERALKIETEYNKTVKARSLIIKFPDPDLNKDIVREFHPGIQNIHFQSPSGPRYCFIQMAENVNIDEAIKELEKIPFGIGYLKVERKSLRDEDNPMLEEIDPYILYVGNLPETVNVSEVKSKFPTASRVDVGYAQKMRNTRYAFVRYNSVDESIAAYKQTHNLMWDTRSIIVRFRRQRGNTCLSGEPKLNVKKVEEEPSKTSKTKEQKENNNEKKSTQQLDTNGEHRLQDNNNTQGKQNSQTQQQNINVQSSQVSESVTSVKTAQQQAQPEQPPQILSASEITPPCPSETEKVPETLLTEFKLEPEDYEDLYMTGEEEDDDDEDEQDIDDDDDDDNDDDDDDEDDDNDNEEDDDNDNEEDEDDEDNINLLNVKQQHVLKDTEPSDHLDQMFNELENITSNIGF